jgi:glyoxylase-like metal-dependent hydrolase (beta-lactamase superfamily II)
MHVPTIIRPHRPIRSALTAATILAAVAATTTSAQRGPAPPPLVREGATEKISDHVYVIPDNNVGMVPNVGIIVGTRATLVVDTGLGARNGQTIVREMQKVSKTPELYLASTHIHPEHDLGAGGFPAHTKMIRSQAQVAEIASDKMQTAQRFAGISPLNAELLAGAEFRRADITFEKEHVLDLGGVRVRILAVGYNHTPGDTVFFVEPDGVLFSGDVVMTALPNVGNSRSSQWLASMDLFDSLRPRRIVPSHGPMGDLSLVAAYRTFLTTVRTRTAELKKQGKTIAEVEQTLTTELGPAYPTAGGRLTGTIRAIYNEQ